MPIDPESADREVSQPTARTLDSSLAALLSESQKLRTDVHGAEEARRRATAVNLGVLLLLFLFVGLLLVLGWQNNRLAHQVAKTNSTMADCTTPGGKCYQQGSERTGNAIASIIRAQVYMAECARLWPNESGVQYDTKLEACVYARLAEAAAKDRAATPSPTPSVSRR